MSVDQPVQESGFERTPPNDIMAEQCVLGGMLLSKEAITQVVEILRSADFYRPAHQTIYDTMIDLFSRGEPVDAISVNAELTKRGEITRVGGAPYLHTLTEAVPTAANAGYYARIVSDRAVLRRLVEVGTRIAQIGYSGDGEVDDLVDRAQAEIYRVAENRTGEDYLPLSEIMPGALDEIEAISSHDGSMTGVPTGFTDFDALSNGLHPGQMIIIAARPAVGKALSLDTPLPTPDGWTTMGRVRVGDLLLAADGTPTRVVAATDVMTGRPCYEVVFDDGSTVVADAEHLWLTEGGPSERSAPPRVRTTREIAATIGGPGTEYSVRTTEPLELPERGLPLPPYLLGVLLGSGSQDPTRTFPSDPELSLLAAAESVALRPVEDHADETGSPHSPDSPRGPCGGGPPRHGDTGLDAAGVAKGGSVPREYLRSSEPQRRALLAGLLDAGATVSDRGEIRFAADRALAEGVRELLAGLGYRYETGDEHGGEAGQGAPARHITAFTTFDEVFRLERKKLAHKEGVRRHPPRPRARLITGVRPVDSVPVRCVQVDNPDHLYLAGRSMVPTHNSTLGLDFARAASIKHQLTSVFFSLEMGRNEIVMRLLSAEARVPLHTMRSGLMTDEDWTRLARRMGEVASAPLFIDDSPNMTMMEIRAKCRRLKQQHDLKLVVVDYLQLMSSPGRVESRQQEVSEMSRSLKLLAKELEVPVVALSQLNRGPEQRTDKKPQVSDLRESGCLTADTRVLRADTGVETTLGALLASGERDVPVWSLDERLKLVPRTMTHVFPSGRKETYRLRLRSGREVTASANHPFLSHDGWRPLGELSPGTRIAAPRYVPAPRQGGEWPDDEVVLLAHLLGSGSFGNGSPIRFVGAAEAALTAVAKAAAHFGVAAVHGEGGEARPGELTLPAPDGAVGEEPNPVAVWLDRLELLRAHDRDRFVPAEVFALPTRQIALFLGHLWASGGSADWDRAAGRVRLRYTSSSRRMVDDIAGLLLRFGVVARIDRLRGAGARDRYRLSVPEADDQRRFLAEIDISVGHGAEARDWLTRLETESASTAPDAVSARVEERVRESLGGERPPQGPEPAAVRSREGAPLGRVAALLRDAGLEMSATNDVFWDEVAQIEPLGEQEVYDATVLGTHNFVANGISVHNSIEQDADMVILLYREDVHEKESPRAGEADLIVAKHRNGPTATVTVAFQGHYSRFVDMAPG